MSSQEAASLPEITTGNSGEAQTQTQTQIQTAQSTDVVVKPTGKKDGWSDWDEELVDATDVNGARAAAESSQPGHDLEHHRGGQRCGFAGAGAVVAGCRRAALPVSRMRSPTRGRRPRRRRPRPRRPSRQPAAARPRRRWRPYRRRPPPPRRSPRLPRSSATSTTSERRSPPPRPPRPLRHRPRHRRRRRARPPLRHRQPLRPRPRRRQPPAMTAPHP